MYKKGKIILTPFPFTDLSSSKVRPAVIVSDSIKGEDIVAAFISSIKSKRSQKTDVTISSSSKTFSQTGLKTNSVIKVGKIATLDKKIILGEIGSIDISTKKEIDKKLKALFGL
ncbi:MAG: type II toxin-antitoxin system PemK/MazF family toxin [Candidatus Paceibacteria bacterium]